MHKYALIFLWAVNGLVISGCRSEQSRTQKEIAKIEEAMEDEVSASEATTLIEKYEAYVQSFPEDHEQNARYLYRAAGLAYRMNRFSRSIELLNEALYDHHDASNTHNNALLLGAIYEDKLRNEKLSRTVYQAAARAFPDQPSVQEKVDPTWSSLDDRLTDMKNQVFGNAGTRVDYRMANDFINSASIYALILPANERSVDWLFEAAETARSIRAYTKALELFNWIARRFPNSEKAAEALFLKAFTLDNDLGRLEEAKTVYASFLEQFPNNEFADDARFLLENIGKDEEEIIRSFEEKNQAVQ